MTNPLKLKRNTPPRAWSPQFVRNDDPRLDGQFVSKQHVDLLKFDGPPERFLSELLATQCRLANAAAAAVLRDGEKGRLQILAAYPEPAVGNTGMDWFAGAEKSVRMVLVTGEPAMVRQPDASENGDAFRCHWIVIPFENARESRAAAAFLVHSKTEKSLVLNRARLETTSLLLKHYEMGVTLKSRQASVDFLRRALDVLDVVNGSNRFLGAAMALCNELAVRWDCSRVSFGMLVGRYVQVRAMSHTEAFSRQMKLVQAIEAAMEECLDQDLELIHPAADPATYASRATARLARNHGPSSVLNLPIRERGEVKAVLTLERPSDRPFEKVDEIEGVRLIGDLCAPRLFDLRRSDRWIGAHLASWLRRTLGLLVGYEHAGVKVGALLFFLIALVLATTEGDFRIDASFVLKSRYRQAVVAPFDTFTKSVLVEPGDRVEGGKTVLGTLETAELRLKLAALEAERLAYHKQMAAAMRDRKTAESQIASAQSDKLTAQITLVKKKIDQATLMAPISGRIVSQDLKQQIGAPVDTGKILFEIARIGTLRAELHVPEAFITSIAAGQHGELATLGDPGKRVEFEIDRVNPIAEVVDNQNVFSVRTGVLEHLEWMRPGMEGRARIFAGKRSYLWMASHRLMDWLRMKMWI